MSKRTIPGDPQGGAERIRKAAIKLFRERGYHGTSVRDLAQAVQMETASLYYHYASKQDILGALFDCTMDEMMAGVEQAAAGTGGAEQRLREAVRFHVEFHVARQDEAFISHSELRALSAQNLERVIVKRDRYEKFMRSVLVAGVEEGCFEIADVRVAATAILMMCSGVSDWFERSGRLSGAIVAEHYADLVVRMVVSGGAPGAARPKRAMATRKPPVGSQATPARH